MTIDGYTQPGAHPNTLAVGNDAALRIELSGALAGEQAAGLDVRSPATIRGLVINRFDRVGISIQISEVTVAGCFVGTDPTGSVALPNRYGVSAFPEQPKVPLPLVGTVIGGLSAADRNLVSGNVYDGVSVFASSGTEFLGNYIGTNAAGDAALPNGGAGIVVNSSEKARVGGGKLARETSSPATWAPAFSSISRGRARLREISSEPARRGKHFCRTRPGSGSSARN